MQHTFLSVEFTQGAKALIFGLRALSSSKNCISMGTIMIEAIGVRALPVGMLPKRTLVIMFAGTLGIYPYYCKCSRLIDAFLNDGRSIIMRY